MTRGKPSRAKALFDSHYAWSARRSGADEPKKAAAGAKRLATGLSTAVTDFGGLLEAGDLQALREAAAAMRRLAVDLDGAAKLADKAKRAHEADYERERRERADATAAVRWTDDDAMLDEARALADFFDAWHARDVPAWLRGRLAPHLTIMALPDLEVGGRLLDMLARAGSPPAAAALPAIRRRAAEYLRGLERASSSERSYKEIHYVGLDDFDAWRTWRRQLDALMPGPGKVPRQTP